MRTMYVSLLFLAISCVQLINGQAAFQVNSKPVVVEKQGIDQYGNKYYQKEVSMSSIGGIMTQQEPSSRVFNQMGNYERQFNNKLNMIKQKRIQREQDRRERPMMNFLASAMNHGISGLKELSQFWQQPPQVQSPWNFYPAQPEQFSDSNIEQRESSLLSDEHFDWIDPNMESNSVFDLIDMNKMHEHNKPDKLGYLANKNANTKHLLSQKQEKINVIGKDEDYFDKLVVKETEKTIVPEMKEASSQNEAQKQKQPSIELVDSSYVYVQMEKPIHKRDVELLIDHIESVPKIWLENFTISGNVVYFKLKNGGQTSDMLLQEINSKRSQINKDTGLTIVADGLGTQEHYVEVLKKMYVDSNSENFFIVTIIVCVTVACVLFSLLIIFLVRRRNYLRNKLTSDVAGGSIHKSGKHFNDEEHLIASETTPWSAKLKSVWPFRCSKTDSTLNTTNETTTPSQNYKELCRQRMHGKATPVGDNTSVMSNESTPSVVPSRAATNSNGSSSDQKVDSSRSSTSSWSEEPITSVNMDITTGHVILAYIEEHLNDKNRLDKEWKDLVNYEADSNKTEAASMPQNMTKNRYSNILAYDHNRVKLENNKESDYINASYITDDDPKNPAYIATQGPLIHTTCDFWKMIWDQGSVVVVSLCRTVEYGSLKCNQYWPANGCEVYDKFEVHLVSEHVWCDDYLVRSFYLKNLETNQSRTVTQFHFLTWPENNLPPNIKSILDFRRKVNKSYKSKSSPIIVHCNDGIGRTGTYIMIDMVLNKIIKGAKEIDLAAIVEFLRDQRIGMIKSKSQFEFSFAVITEEVQNMLKAMTQ